MRPLLSLVMIVCNEAVSIQAVLNSVRGVVDHWTIVDTGSTDKTVEVLGNYVSMFAEKGRVIAEPYIAYAKIEDHKIIDFAATRNRALVLEEDREDAALFTLFLSGDEVLQGGKELREFLETRRDDPDDAYCVMLQTGSIFLQYPRILRVGAGRHYVNPIHEVPIGKNGETGGTLIPGVTVIHDATDRLRLYKRMKEVDLPILTQIAEAPASTHDEHAAKARAISFLGQTHEVLAEDHPRDPGSAWLSHKMAAMAYYWRRSELGGDPDDVHYAIFHYLNIAETIGFYTDEELVNRLQPLVELDPRRPEVRYMLAAHSAALDPRRGAFLAEEAVQVARQAREKPLHLPTDVRVEWLSLRLAAECAKLLEKPERAKEMAEQGIAAGGPVEAFASYQ